MYAVIDTETTGLDPKRHRVIEIAIISLDAHLRFEGEWTTVVNPGGPVGPTRIHGLRASDVTRAMPFEAHADDVRARLGGRCIVGHNVEFDWAMLAAEWSRLGQVAPVRPRTICTAKLARRARIRPYTLDSCCRAFGINHDAAHTALGDARATAALLRKMLRPALSRSLLVLTVVVPDLIPAVR